MKTRTGQSILVSRPKIQSGGYLQMPSGNRYQPRRYSRASLVRAICFLFTALHCTSGHADERRLPIVGELWYGNQVIAAPYQGAFRAGLREHGYVEGRNLTIVARYADGDSGVLPALAAELVAMKVDVLLVNNRTVGAAKRATTTLPIVCIGFSDPVAEGHVSSFARPGGNITGLSWQSPETSSKRLELALEVVPRLRQVAQLFDAADPSALVEATAARKAAEHVGLKVRGFAVHDTAELDAAFGTMEKSPPQALFVTHTPFTVVHRAQIMWFAASHKIPVISEGRDFAEVGALLTYGAYDFDLFKRGATYVDKILKGANPRDLPIEQAARFELVVNVKTAKALGITIPESVLLRADDVIR